MSIRFLTASTVGLWLLASAAVWADEAATAPEVDYCSLAPLSQLERERYTAALEDRINTPAEERANAALTLAGHDIAAANANERRCRRAFADGEKDFQRELRRQLRKADGGAGAADSEDPAIRAVQRSLREAYIADQAARLAYLELATEDRTGADYWARRLATAHAIRLDAAHTELLAGLLQDYDWIDAHRFGPKIASHAWLLAQHADARPDVQREALRRMEPYLDNGGVRAADYAYLFDRVAVNTGGLQRYGTQPQSECNADGSLSPKPLEDPRQVDERRAALGLGPMADAMADMASRRCR